MVAIFKNGRRNIHVLISQFLKENFKYANLIFDYRGSHFFPKIYNINALIAQFLIDLEKKSGHFSKSPPEYTCFNISVSN